MVKLDALRLWLDDLLKPELFDDYSENGLQVEGRKEINRIVTGVSVSERLFNEAVYQKADAIIVHHGLFWKKDPHSLRGITRNRAKLLLENDISLFAYHLPLDAHPELGNNARIAGILELENIRFLPITGMKQPLSAFGRLPEKKDFDSYQHEMNLALETIGLGLRFGEKQIENVYILSGGGGGYYLDAAASGADLFVTGELREETVRAAEELGLNLYAAGHYNSEKFGIRALTDNIAQSLDVEIEYVDVPNPI